MNDAPSISVQSISLTLPIALYFGKESAKELRAFDLLRERIMEVEGMVRSVSWGADLCLSVIRKHSSVIAEERLFELRPSALYTNATAVECFFASIRSQTLEGDSMTTEKLVRSSAFENAATVSSALKDEEFTDVFGGSQQALQGFAGGGDSMTVAFTDRKKRAAPAPSKNGHHQLARHQGSAICRKNRVADADASPSNVCAASNCECDPSCSACC
eukprot:TRINITY_DN5147_c0_g1_i3.p1 TRINITY_DN5147_c0_g1~~TRINITY_DN5147_c0_g1_i3.p1  ORF type:complete len:216 (-),score=45.26 TRINITY_DN5147_c0_g1_i3:612-1259(-)